jgi:centrosomal protein CEP41
MHQREKQARKFAHAERNLTRIQQDLDLPYLLLDIRDRDEYDQCHIITALNYPTAMLSRSMNNESPELLVYKNQPGKIIVVYDDDEKIGNRAATTLVQRGYDNLFLLSGGKWHISFYMKFVEGKLIWLEANLPI